MYTGLQTRPHNSARKVARELSEKLASRYLICQSLEATVFVYFSCRCDGRQHRVQKVDWPLDRSGQSDTVVTISCANRLLQADVSGKNVCIFYWGKPAKERNTFDRTQRLLLLNAAHRAGLHGNCLPCRPFIIRQDGLSTLSFRAG